MISGQKSPKLDPTSIVDERERELRKIDFNCLNSCSLMVVVIEIPLLIHDCCRYGREAYADPYTLGHGVGPVPGGYGVRRR